MAVIKALGTCYLEADAASVTFSSIPATYEHLQLRFSGRSNRTSSWLDAMRLQFNGDTASNYANHNINANGTNVHGGRATSQSSADPSYLAAAGIDASEYSASVIDILDYANGNKNTTTIGSHVMSLTYPTTYLRFFSGLWLNTAAVTSVTCALSTASWTRGSEFTLYGLNSS
jgi:hypothetical protein